MYITKEHTDIINSIDAMGGNTTNCGAPEIVTGSRDGNYIEKKVNTEVHTILVIGLVRHFFFLE